MTTHKTDLLLEAHELHDIRGSAMGVLREIEALRGDGPVDLDAAMKVANLTLAGAIELDTKEKERLRERFGPLVDKMLSAVQGMVHFGTNEVYIQKGLYPARERFVKGHEIGHALLNDHRISIGCLDDRERLSPEFADRLERQANEFSIELLAKGDRLRSEFDDSVPTLELLVELSDRYGISLQAASRRLAERSRRPIAITIGFRTAGGLRTKTWSSGSFVKATAWTEVTAPRELLLDRLRAAEGCRPAAVLEPLIASAGDRLQTFTVEGRDCSRFVLVLMVLSPGTGILRRRFGHGSQAA